MASREISHVFTRLFGFKPGRKRKSVCLRALRKLCDLHIEKDLHDPEVASTGQC
jgi:hypothetical protein